ncbi:MAG: diguanylate cyclase [Francisellaceae bacterium]|nr:diguanylate cyclase [Francisellaceae bacterium]
MRILIADNNIEHRLNLINIIKSLGHVPEEAVMLQDVLNICKRKSPDILLLDYNLIGLNGVKHIRQLGGNNVWNPIILMSEIITETEQLKMVDSEVDDLLIKPVKLGTLALKLGSVIRLLHLQDKVINKAHHLVMANRVLENVVTQDSLTSIGNSNHFEDTLEREWFRAKETNMPLSLIYFNLDYFQAYNEVYGGATGNETLIKVANLLKTNVRNPDLLARVMGATFAYILPSTTKEMAIREAERYQDLINNLKIPHKKSGCSEYITVSIGVSTINKDKFTQPWDLTEAADYALYQAKHYGRNRLYFVPSEETVTPNYN